MQYITVIIGNVQKVFNNGTIIVVESIVSPGSIDKYVEPYATEKCFKIGEGIHLVHIPERVISGNMIYELLHNNRTIGADDPKIGEKTVFCKLKITFWQLYYAINKN